MIEKAMPIRPIPVLLVSENRPENLDVSGYRYVLIDVGVYTTTGNTYTPSVALSNGLGTVTMINKYYSSQTYVQVWNRIYFAVIYSHEATITFYGKSDWCMVYGI